MAFANMKAWVDKIEKLKADAEAATSAAVAKGAHMIEASGKKHSSGRPGPNVQTGSHRRSYHVEGPRKVGLLQYSAEIGPGEIYSRRLELGFSGADAIGRKYKQPAYPSLASALDEVMPQLESVFEEAWGKTMI